MSKRETNLTNFSPHAFCCHNQHVAASTVVLLTGCSMTTCNSTVTRTSEVFALAVGRALCPEMVLNKPWIANAHKYRSHKVSEAGTSSCSHFQ